MVAHRRRKRGHQGEGWPVRLGTGGAKAWHGRTQNRGGGEGEKSRSKSKRERESGSYRRERAAVVGGSRRHEGGVEGADKGERCEEERGKGDHE